jgi:hypothetical protein
MRSAHERQRAWDRWQAAAGSWKGWAVCPALLAPGATSPPLPLGEAISRGEGSGEPQADELAAQLESSLQQRNTLLLLDLEPVLALRIAARLNERRLANAVLVLPRWPYAHAVLPVDRLVRCLIAEAARLTEEAPLHNVAFVLDNQRSCPLPHRTTADPRADNRYRLAVGDLPDLKALRARNIQRVLKLTQP